MNTSEEVTSDEVYRRGIQALSRELGPVGMVRFLQMFEPGKGDYVEQREELIKSLTRAEIDSELARQNARLHKLAN